MNSISSELTKPEVVTGDWTAAELAEQEQTGEIHVSALLGIVATYQEVLTTKCPNHKQVLIRAMRTAVERRTPMQETIACIDAKLIDILGCGACSAIKK